jgi:transcriptional regulator with PAS, ATPase and Fis domain
MDVGPIVENMLLKLNAELGRNMKGISGEALQALERYPWSGNVCEL